MAMDVTSFSHEYENVPEYHAAAPWKAVGLGESGSCEYDRGEYAGSNRTTGHISLSSGVIGCITQNLAANVIPYSYGSFSWVRRGGREWGSGCVACLLVLQCSPA